jgi:RimJ/RimL family protein N-acetyltransferase
MGRRATAAEAPDQLRDVRVRLRELRDDELPGWLDGMRRFYVDDLVRHGGLTRVEAEAKSNAEHEALFPGGGPAAGNHLFVVEDENGEPIGRLWFAERPFGLWLFAIELDERVRGRGLGRAAMLAFEARARELGAKKVALNVFGGNAVARSLYASLGYTAEAVRMGKRLE